MRYLVTGGAGFVGSHVALGLLDAGHEVVILDNLSTGHRKAVPPGASFEKIDLVDREAVQGLMAQGPWDAVLHFAALSLIGDSMADPYHYLRENALTSLNLIEACTKYHVKRFIFSSTAALFSGECPSLITDHARIDPRSPYGESKFFTERALLWAERLHGMHSACLRYFNAAGADPQGRLGEDHRPETHLIPLALDALLGRRPPLELFGDDYPTRDGTCLRDYIHVTDLAEAHIRAIDQIEESSVTYNIGQGAGFSNLEIIRTIERVSGRKLPWLRAERREGDPAILVADSSNFRQDTGWVPRYSDIDMIVQTALNWRLNHPQGYES